MIETWKKAFFNKNMGGRLSSPPSSTASSAATAHRNPTTGSTTNLSHSRTHANNSGHRRHSTQNRHRSSTGRFRSSNYHWDFSNLISLDDISSTTNHFNLNLLHHLGLDHESDEPSTEDDSPQTRRHIPRIFIALRDISCPVCHKTIPSDSFDKHILQCLAKPRVDYNGLSKMRFQTQNNLLNFFNFFAF